MLVVKCIVVTVLVYVVDSEDCSPQGRPDLKCDVIDSGSACTDKGPAYTGYPDEWPAAPKDVFVEPYSRLGDDHKFRAGFIFKWSLPENVSSARPSAFQMNLTPVGFGWGGRWCRLFNLTDTTGNISNHHGNQTARFIYDLDMDDDRQTYQVYFKSLPRGPPNWQQSMVDTWWIKIPRPTWEEDVDNTGFWYSTVVVKWSPLLHRLDVQFVKAPDSYRFTEYQVGLKNRSYVVIQEQIVKANLSNEIQYASIFNVCPGAHDVMIRPHDRDPWNHHGKCVCTYKGECMKSRGTCYTTNVFRIFLEGPPCDVTTTAAPTSTSLTTTADVQTTLPSTELQTTSSPAYDITTSQRAPPVNHDPDNQIKQTTPPSAGTDYTAGAVLGAVVGVSLIVALLLAIRYRRRWLPYYGDGSIAGKGSSLIDRMRNVERAATGVQNVNEAFDDQDGITNRVRVFILYNSDNVYHENIVSHVASFLHNMCACDVIIDRWCQTEIRHKTKLDWLQEQITDADKVVIVHSEGAFRRWRAMKEGRIYEKAERNSTTDTFLPGLRLVSECLQNPVVDFSRFISVRFNYTNREFEIPTLAVGISKYELMDNLADLFFHVHGMNNEEPGLLQQAQGINDRDFSKYSDEGRKLYESLVSMHNFVNEHPKWFDELYGEPAASQSATPQVLHNRPAKMAELPVAAGNPEGADDATSVFSSDDCETIHREEINFSDIVDMKSTSHVSRLDSSVSFEV